MDFVVVAKLPPPFFLFVVGFAKTPDVLLRLPISIDGKVVRWIDSKAMYGDYKSHTREHKSQLDGYLNRFGPGLFVCWEFVFFK